MRISGGRSCGMKLKSPKGLKTRPMIDRVKQALFNIVRDYIEDACVLDLFAGSGALGLDALSRGARYCHFVENGTHVLPVLRENIKKMDCEEQSQIWVKDAHSITHALELEEAKFGFIFFDPPYPYIDHPESRRKILALMVELVEFCEQEFCMVLHCRRGVMAGFTLPLPLVIESVRAYGSTELIFITKKEI